MFIAAVKDIKKFDFWRLFTLYFMLPDGEGVDEQISL